MEGNAPPRWTPVSLVRGAQDAWPPTHAWFSLNLQCASSTCSSPGETAQAHATRGEGLVTGSRSIYRMSDAAMMKVSLCSEMSLRKALLQGVTYLNQQTWKGSSTCSNWRSFKNCSQEQFNFTQSQTFKAIWCLWTPCRDSLMNVPWRLTGHPQNRDTIGC